MEIVVILEKPSIAQMEEHKAVTESDYQQTLVRSSLCLLQILILIYLGVAGSIPARRNIQFFFALPSLPSVMVPAQLFSEARLGPIRLARLGTAHKPKQVEEVFAITISPY